MLTLAERERLDAAVAGVEARSGAQIVVACVPKSDTYPELPWTAFAAAASFAALAVVVTQLFWPSWVSGAVYFLIAASILGAGAAAALAAVFLPAFARLFLREARIET